MAELVLSRHARLAVDRRRIGRGELRSCVYHPDTVEKGRGYRVELRRKCIEGRVLTAVIRPTRRKLLLVTAYRDQDPRGDGSGVI